MELPWRFARTIVTHDADAITSGTRVRSLSTTHTVDVIMIGADIAGLIAADGLVAAYGHVSTRTRGFDPDHPAADLAIVTESAIVDAPLEASCCRRERPGRAPSLLASRPAFGIAIAAPTTQDQQEPGVTTPAWGS
jgi:hypothetical protein